MNKPGILKISGRDAKKFLQGQLTCNMEEISPTQSKLGAHCNPQGRILSLFRIFERDQSYYLVLPQEMLPLATQCLKKYAAFYSATLTEHDNEQFPIEKVELEWKFFDVSQGIAKIYPETSGKFLPHDLNLHLNEGISWNKGCYTGQEIIARMHYRGKLKNHLYRARVQSTSTPLVGSSVYSENSESGIIADWISDDSQNFQLLIVTDEQNSKKSALTLNPTQPDLWEWLSLHG